MAEGQNSPPERPSGKALARKQRCPNQPEKGSNSQTGPYPIPPRNNPDLVLFSTPQKKPHGFGMGLD